MSRARAAVDQYSFSVGVIGIVLGQYVMLSHETWFHVCALLVPGMYAVKIPMYRMQKLHHFLFDFCYYANMLLLLYLFVPSLRADCGFSGVSSSSPARLPSPCRRGASPSCSTISTI